MTTTEIARTTTARTPTPTVLATFQADDATAMIDFLVDVVGFRRNAVHHDGDLVAHAQLDWPEGGGIMLGSRRATSGVAPGSPASTSSATTSTRCTRESSALRASPSRDRPTTPTKGATSS